MHNLSVIIPFYNENKYLLDSVNRVLKTGIANQIILSDDFSNDGSEKIAGSTADLTVSVERAGNTLVYTDSTQGWLLKNK